MRAAITVLLGIATTAGLLTGCSFQDNSAEPNPTGVATKMPEDTDRAASVEQAKEFRAWVGTHGTGSQQEAAERVQRIIGDWDSKAAAAFISTDINGGPTPVDDPIATAQTIVKTFTSYTRSATNKVSVYDVYGNILTGNTST